LQLSYGVGLRRPRADAQKRATSVSVGKQLRHTLEGGVMRNAEGTESGFFTGFLRPPRP